MELRPDPEIITKSLVFKFGDKEYEVPVLRMTPAAKWRKEYLARVQEIRNRKVEDQTDNPALTARQVSQAIGDVFTGALLSHAEMIPEIVFSYAPSLPREEIGEIAYDQQFVVAFNQIVRVAFAPFLESLEVAMELAKVSGFQSASSGSLN